MESGRARSLYQQYAAAMAYVAVEYPNGDQGIGSAVHVGEGVFVTARHVVEGNKILEVAATARTYVRLGGEEAAAALTTVVYGEERYPAHLVDNGVMEINEGPFYHPADSVDLAVFKVRHIDAKTPAVPLGDHLDDWLGSDDFVLSEAIVLGYPPIPLTTGPVLVGARAEVGAMVDRLDAPHPHFILSTMPRGGFSGGLALSESGVALGIVTTSLVNGGAMAELGYMAVVSVEPVYVCLAEHKLLPACQAEGWDGLWHSTAAYFTNPRDEDGLMPASAAGGKVCATIEIFDDGRKVSVNLTCADSVVRGRAVTGLKSFLRESENTLESPRSNSFRFDLKGEYSVVARSARQGAYAVTEIFRDAGYLPIGSVDFE